jgi:hypothetical protein
MAPPSFRNAAVVCSVLTATLGFGFLAPTAASASPAASTTAARSSAPASDLATATGSTDIDAIPVAPSLGAPRFLSDWSTLHGARTIAGDAGGDAVWLVGGDTVYDYSTAGGLMVLNVQDRHEDAQLEVIRVHTSDDGTQTRTERIPLPWAITVTGLQDDNTFAPGKVHFGGTASAGATITAKDTTTGATLFTTEATDARSGTGSWSADAELSDTGHVITLTQTTTTGRTTELRGLTFSPAHSGTPNAPIIETTDRLIDGSFAVAGAFDATVGSVIVQDEGGTTIAEADLDTTGWIAKVPQEHIGSTVYVVGRAAEGTLSPRVATRLEQLPTDTTAAMPSLRSVTVYPNGRMQVLGDPGDAPARWILDGDRVVASVIHGQAGWSYTIDADSTGKQLDVANLVFDGVDWGGLSERIPLPRLLQVDGLADANTYTPGTRTFTGTAEAGATITATDQDGRELFQTKVLGARSGVGPWKAAAELTSRDGYELTFTQTTADGRESVMRDVAFAAAADTVVPPTVSTESVTAGVVNHFTGTATPGATFRVLNPSGTQIVPGSHDVATDGTWSFDRVVSKGATKFDFVIEQTVGGTVTTSRTFSLSAS